ncbi:hypothetical protein KY329_04140 [Candidatus Woesearchaeota archaeon]|nr:hypothetical protein [Candidatus Woesearchaeota archaeon]
MEEDVFYVGVSDPAGLRRDCLLGGKALLDILKRYEVSKELRENKLSYTHELKRVFDEILVLNRKMRSMLPKVPEAPGIASPVKKNVKTSLPKTHMDILEDELAKIEERLEALK